MMALTMLIFLKCHGFHTLRKLKIETFYFLQWNHLNVIKDTPPKNVVLTLLFGINFDQILSGSLAPTIFLSSDEFYTYRE